MGSPILDSAACAFIQALTAQALPLILLFRHERAQFESVLGPGGSRQGERPCKIHRRGRRGVEISAGKSAGGAP